MSEKISIIVPIYNVSLYIDRCLNSIIKQTYTNIEIILIDDGSGDNSLNKCLEWKKKDERITVITKQNEGLGITRNMGVKIAKGNYIVFIDSDDYVEEILIEKLYNCITLYQADMVFCDRYNVIDEKANMMLSVLDIDERTSFWEERILLTEMPVHLWGKMFKRELFIKNNLWMTEHYVEDGEFLPKLLSICKSIAQVKEPLYYYITDRSDSIMMSKRKEIIEQIPEIFESMVKFLQENDSFERMKKDMEIYMVSKYIRWFYKDINSWIPYEIEGKQEKKKKIEDKLTQYFGENWKNWITDRRKRFLLWGSPVLKAYTIRYDIATYIYSKNLIIRYNFSSLISAMSKKVLNLKSKSPVFDNEYRKKMFEADIQKDFYNNAKQILENTDIIIIDFLEERYDIIEIEGNYYTKNIDFNKFYCLQDKKYRIIKRNSEEATLLWKDSCRRFIHILQKFFMEKTVYLVKNYIYKNMRDYCCSCSVEEMNSILNDYYEFFIKNFQRVKIIK